MSGRRLRAPRGPLGTLRLILLYLRSLLFSLGFWLITPPFALLSLLSFPLAPIARYHVISKWTRFILFWLKVTCRINFRVKGIENIPAGPAVIMAKHQSTWETLALQVIFPPQVWVIKRQLLRVPFFGWGLAMLSPIAIDRGSGRAALKQILEQGTDRLKKGLWVVVFPEGTRVAPGKRGRYGIGGGWLAVHTGASVVPVAHNAGEFWPKGGFLKRPGIIDLRIGPPVSSINRSPAELTHAAETWIEAEMALLSKDQSRL